MYRIQQLFTKLFRLIRLLAWEESDKSEVIGESFLAAEPAESDSRTLAICSRSFFRQASRGQVSRTVTIVPGNFTGCSGLPLEMESETGADQMLLHIEIDIKFPLSTSNKPPCVGFSHGN